MEVAAEDIRQLGGSVELVDIGKQKVGAEAEPLLWVLQALGADPCGPWTQTTMSPGY